MKNANKGVRQALFFSVVITTPVVTNSGAILAAEGLTSQFTLGQRLQYKNEEGISTNEDEGALSRTDLGLTVTSETRTQRLSFNVQSGLTYNLSNDDALDRTQLEDPRARLSYAIESRKSRLTVDGSYRRAYIDETVFFDDDPLINEDIITGGGRRETIALRTGLVVGQDAPVTLSLDHFYGQTNYTNADPGLVDSETNGLDGRVTFQINPQLTANVFASWRERDAAAVGSNDRTTQKIGAGASYDISSTLRATAQISYQQIETDDNAGSRTETDGVGFQFGLARDLPNGTLSFNFSEDETVNGKQRQVSVGRSYAFKRGAFNFSLGATKTDGLNTEFLANGTLTYELDARSKLTGKLSQSSQVSDDNETTVNTRLGLTYARELTALSRVTAGLQLINRNALSAGAQDQMSIRLNVSHRYELARDWDLVSGLTYSSTSRDTQADRKSSTLFVGVEKSFDFRP